MTNGNFYRSLLLVILSGASLFIIPSVSLGSELIYSEGQVNDSLAINKVEQLKSRVTSWIYDKQTDLLYREIVNIVDNNQADDSTVLASASYSGSRKAKTPCL